MEIPNRDEPKINKLAPSILLVRDLIDIKIT